MIFFWDPFLHWRLLYKRWRIFLHNWSNIPSKGYQLLYGYLSGDWLQHVSTFPSPLSSHLCRLFMRLCPVFSLPRYFNSFLCILCMISCLVSLYSIIFSNHVCADFVWDYVQCQAEACLQNCCSQHCFQPSYICFVVPTLQEGGQGCFGQHSQ